MIRTYSTTAALVLLLMLIAYGKSGAQATAPWKKLHADAFLSLSKGSGRFDAQTNYGMGGQLRVYHQVDDDTTGGALAVGLNGSFAFYPPRTTDLSNFTLGAIGPELLFFLPSQSRVTPYLGARIGLGMISRADDKGDNTVDYHFSETVLEGGASLGLRVPIKRIAIVTELSYSYLSSKQLGGTSLFNLNIGLGL